MAMHFNYTEDSSKKSVSHLCRSLTFADGPLALVATGWVVTIELDEVFPVSETSCWSGITFWNGSIIEFLFPCRCSQFAFILILDMHTASWANISAHFTLAVASLEQAFLATLALHLSVRFTCGAFY